VARSGSILLFDGCGGFDLRKENICDS
jgi:hypothetical protein